MRISLIAAAGVAVLGVTAAQGAPAPIGSVCPPPGLAAPYTCVETYGGGSLGVVEFTNNPNPQFSFVTTGAGTQTAGSVGGAGGSSSVVSVLAGPGLVRAIASATSDVLSRSLGVARARVVMLDSFTVGSATAALGSPILTRLSVTFDGAFAGDGEARGEFSATGISTTTGSVLVGRPSLTLSFDRTYLVGQVVDYRFQFDVQASAGPGSLGSFADLRNTVHIFADALTAGGSLRSASGADYSATAVPPPPPPPLGVPEPATGVLMALALFGLTLARRQACRA